jgi:sugar phosphate permease
MVNALSIGLSVGVLSLVSFAIAADLLYNPRGKKFSVRLRRLSHWLPMGVSYALFYMGRYNIAFLVDTRVSEHLGITESSYGTIITTGFWVYAFTGPFTGLVGDTWGAKKVFVLGCFCSGLTNIAMGLLCMRSTFKKEGELFGLAILYSLNFVFQGLGTAVTSKLNSAWYEKEEKTLFGGIFGVVISCGFFLNLFVGNYIVHSLPWYFVFIVPGCLLIVMSVVDMFLIVPEGTTVEMKTAGNFDEKSPDGTVTFKNVDRKIELEEISVENSQTPEQIHRTGFKEFSVKFREILEGKRRFGIIAEIPLIGRNPAESAEISTETVQQRRFADLKDTIFEGMKTAKENKAQYIMISLFCMAWIRESLLMWFIPFTGSRGIQDGSALFDLISAGQSLGAMIGGIVCGIVASKVFKGSYAPAVALFFSLLMCVLSLLFFHDRIIVAISLILCFVFSFGIQNTLGITALLSLGSGKGGASFTGLITSFQYASSGFSGFINGILVEKYGFAAWTTTLLPFCAVGLISMIFLSIFENRKRKQEMEALMREQTQSVSEA